MSGHPIFVTIEGRDGAGKSTACGHLQREAERRGARVFPLTKDHPELINYTRALQNKDLGEADKLQLRVARERAKSALAASASCDLVLADRGLISLLAHARLASRDTDLLVGQLRQIARERSPAENVLVSCPPDTAWQRVQRRCRSGAQALSEKERRLGADGCRLLGDILEQLFFEAHWVGRRVVIENSKETNTLQEGIASFLNDLLGGGAQCGVLR